MSISSMKNNYKLIYCVILKSAFENVKMCIILTTDYFTVL